MFTKVKERIKEKEYLRMTHWVFIALSFYLIAISLASVGPTFYPQVQTITWKLGNLTTASFVGYWIDRNAFRVRITEDSSPLEHIRRAIIMVGAMIAVSLGM